MLVGGMTYRAVFFDAGETLVHPHPSFPELLSDLLGREGIYADPIDVREGVSIVADHFARAAEDGVLWTTSAHASKAFWMEVYRAFLARVGAGDRVGLPERLYGAFTDLSNYRLFDDVLPVLHRLKGEGLTLGVISNFEEWLERLLVELRVADLFDLQVISGIEGVEKPDTAIFRIALERAGMEAAGCVYVGDNPIFDTTPAEAVGMRGVLIDRRGRFPDHAGPGVRITSMSDLPEAIGLHPSVATMGLA
jgi:putative hydrolase of the HAD superfamily